MARKITPPLPPKSNIRLVGYARVSTEDQSLNLQLDALRRAGVMEENLHFEKVSAASKKRDALNLAMKDLRPGDTLVVWRLDRLARSMRDLYKRLDEINEAGAAFRSLQENFDFSTATGKFMLAILGAVAELERQLIAQRTAAGMASAAARGAKLGAKRKMTPERIAEIKAALKEEGATGQSVAKKFGISASSIYQWRERKWKPLPKKVKAIVSFLITWWFLNGSNV
jgi:DNA invertase Pin-like site-specific DNA recombinase